MALLRQSVQKGSGRRAVFLDRDGTLIVDRGYLRDPAQLLFLPGAAQALQRLRGEGFVLVLVSNQSGIARGLITDQQAGQVHRRLIAGLHEFSVTLDGVYYCPHAPDQGCSCRKPSPGMLLTAAAELGIDLTRSFMVGDRPADIEAGQRAGCRSILLMPDETSWPSPTAGACLARSWPESVSIILDGEADP